MEKYRVAIVFDHRNRTKDGEEGPLEVRITMGRKAYYINSNVRVKRSQWVGSVVNRADMDALNERLGLVVQDVSHLLNEYARDGRDVDIAEIKERLFESPAKKKEKENCLIDWCYGQLKNMKLAKGTRERYEVTLRRMQNYGQITKWSDLTVEKIYEWDRWLHKIKKRRKNADVQAGRKAEVIGDAAVYNYHRCLRAFLSRAIKLGMVDSNIYEKMKGDFSKGVKENVEYLSEEEMQAVMSLHPMQGSRMAVARDLFVFQLFTGLSYTDAQNFNIKDYKLSNGKYVSVGTRIKTGVPFVSQLLPPAVEVLERYGMQVPKIENADYNYALKAIQMAAGITTRLHSHLARHTFATYMLRHGVKIENLAKMMGHSTIRETQKYAKVLAASVHEEFAKIAEMMEKETAGENPAAPNTNKNAKN